MNMNMERWYDAVSKRCSVRKYESGPNEEQLKKLTDTANMLQAHGVRIVVGTGEDLFAPIFLGYGKIKGTNGFAAILSNDAPQYTLGYLGEMFVLECTAMGLGTCWLGVSYHKEQVQALIQPEAGETTACVIAIGKSAVPYVARARKSMQKLTGLTAEEFQALPAWIQAALDCARLAPSAVNGQPWQFIVDGNTIRIRCTNRNYGYGWIDCGIAMLHMELGAKHLGVAGDWKFDDDDAVFVPLL